MNTPVTIKFLLSVLTLVLLSVTASAQTATPVDLSRCAAITNVIERLACFDALALGNPPTATSSIPTPAQAPEVASVPKPEASQANPSPANKIADQKNTSQAATAPVATFGQQTATVQTSDTGAQALLDTVLAVKQVEPTKQLITLASGQIWKQSIGKRFIIRSGDTIRITDSGWGKDFRLSVEGRKGFIQVTRMQ